MKVLSFIFDKNPFGRIYNKKCDFLYCFMLETWKMMKIQFYVTKGSQSGWNTCRNDMRHIFSDFSSTSHKKAWTCFGGRFSWFCFSCEGVCLSALYTEISNLKNVVFGYKKGWKDVKYIPKCHQSYFKIFLLNISSKKIYVFLMSFFMVILLIWRTMSQHDDEKSQIKIR